MLEMDPFTMGDSSYERGPAVLPWGQDCGCPQDGWPLYLFYSAGGCYVFLCCMWPDAWIGVVGLRCPSLTKWQT